MTIRPDTLMSESKFVPDYDEEIEKPQLKRPRCVIFADPTGNPGRTESAVLPHDGGGTELAKIIGINKDAILHISQSSATFTSPRAVDKSSVSLPTMPKEMNLSTTRCTMMKIPNIAEEAPEALDLSVKNSSPPQISVTANSTPRMCLIKKERIVMLLELEMSCMPLLAPARQDWKKEMQFTFTEEFTVIHWPPEGWTKMKPE
ncbi:hypothetical protein CHS0354_004540 [Potamilus streckersoni]|uniref:Uncharacterized protein n=1 Tax=Potamilus streckersoni TaxID=2493646 RepID=A0AAE0S5Y3_9BIVA|nr:hypothetical protein CHS0354_004540 [Potamilus streckersoni]